MNPVAGANRVVLSRELADFILAFSGAFQKFVMYPTGHPALEGAVRSVYRRLEVIFLDRNALAVGVTPTQLIISGVPTDPKQVLLKDLAGHLHKRNIGGIKITRAVSRTELEEAFAAIAHQNFASAKDPHDTSPALPYWPHLRLYPLTYDHLELLEDEEEENRAGPGGPEEASWSKRLWMNLARAAIGDDVSEPQAAELDPTELAAAIAQRVGDDEYQDQVLGGLVDYAKAARNRGQAEAAVVQRQLSRMLASMTPETAEEMLSFRGTDGSRQRAFLMEASHVLTADVVYRLVEASAHATSRDISPALLAMLSKLSAHAMLATDGRRAAADGSFRELVRKLLEHWEEGGDQQHLPELYGADSNQLPDLPDVTSSVLAYAPEPERIILMSIESQIVEAGTLRAVDWMMADGKIDQLLMMLEDLSDDPVARVIRDRVYHPRTVSVLLAAEPVDLDTLSRLIPDAGLEAGEMLLDALAASNDRKVRAKLLDLLTRFGADIGSEVVARIPGAPWFVQRNLLHLLGLLPALPPEFVPELCLAHNDPRVRHEGLKLLLRDPAQRDEAIAQAVQAPDLPTLRLGLVSAAESCPPAAVGHILRRLRARDLPEDLATLALRAVGGVEDEAVLEVLLAYVWARRRVLWFRWLAPRSPAMLEALALLSIHWRYHANAVAALKQGEKHRDKLIRQAAGARAEMRLADDDPRLKVII